ncbi:MAG: recombinase family protein [Candidatus Devosia phytovorans]|uniref:Recombinase family protein n=1 Tax=Candidatus Devosia phytovorans TaxID=3121372 RepID=A0AAJ6B0V3_9HYPH|nr:recombinase family protein [Devosia sp.]WEK03893.1 MAG: recombinase family protein [Devosia sp.]
MKNQKQHWLNDPRLARHAASSKTSKLAYTAAVVPRGSTEADSVGKNFVYVRHSTAEQAKGYTVARQLDPTMNFCATQGIDVDRVFIDAGVSGAISDRPALDDLKAECARHPNSTVYTLDTSRWARDHEAVAQLAVEMREVKARLVYVDIGDVDADTAAQSQLDSVKEYHKLQKTMRDGRQLAVLDGKWMGRVPFGYVKIEGRIYPDGEKSQWIAKMYEWRVLEQSYSQIARTLNLEKVPTPCKGKLEGKVHKWTAEMVYLVLRREIHRGLTVCHIPIFDWEKLPGVTGKNLRTRLEVKTEWARIVSDEVFESVWGKRGVGYSKRKSYPYVPSGKVCCRDCNLSLRVQTSHGAIHMKCPHVDPAHVCREVRFSEPKIETLVWRTIADAVGAEARTAYSDNFRRQRELEFEAIKSRRDELAEQILELNRAEETTLSAAFGDVELLAMLKPRLLASRQLAADKQDELDGLPHVGDLETFLDGWDVPFVTALEMASGTVPFRPVDEASRQVLELVRDAIDKIELVEVEDGRFDVFITPSAMLWRGTEPAAPRIFRSEIVTEALGRKDILDREIKRMLAHSKFDFTPDDIAPLDPHGIYRKQFKDDGTVARWMAVAVVLGEKTYTILRHMNLSEHQQDKARAFWKTHAGREMYRLLAVKFGVTMDEERTRPKHNATKSQRVKLVESRHDILRYGPADPESGEIEVSDADWDRLVEAGLAKDSSRLFCSGHVGDRRHINGLLWLIRTGSRWNEMPSEYGQYPRIATLMRALDNKGVTGRLTHALLGARGIEPIADVGTVPRFSDRALMRSGKPKRVAMPYDPSVIWRGRKGDHARRVAQAAALKTGTGEK